MLINKTNVPENEISYAAQAFQERQIKSVLLDNVAV